MIIIINDDSFLDKDGNPDKKKISHHLKEKVAEVTKQLDIIFAKIIKLLSRYYTEEEATKIVWKSRNLNQEGKNEEAITILRKAFKEANIDPGEAINYIEGSPLN